MTAKLDVLATSSNLRVVAYGSFRTEYRLEYYGVSGSPMVCAEV